MIKFKNIGKVLSHNWKTILGALGIGVSAGFLASQSYKQGMEDLEGCVDFGLKRAKEDFGEEGYQQVSDDVMKQKSEEYANEYFDQFKLF